MFTKNRLILILGIIVALMPFLGFPTTYKTIFYVILGLAIAILSFMLARHRRIARRPHHKKEQDTEVYAESSPAVRRREMAELQQPDEVVAEETAEAALEPETLESVPQMSSEPETELESAPEIPVSVEEKVSKSESSNP